MYLIYGESSFGWGQQKTKPVKGNVARQLLPVSIRLPRPQQPILTLFNSFFIHFSEHRWGHSFLLRVSSFPSSPSFISDTFSACQNLFNFCWKEFSLCVCFFAWLRKLLFFLLLFVRFFFVWLLASLHSCCCCCWCCGCVCACVVAVLLACRNNKCNYYARRHKSCPWSPPCWWGLSINGNSITHVPAVPSLSFSVSLPLSATYGQTIN